MPPPPPAARLLPVLAPPASLLTQTSRRVPRASPVRGSPLGRARTAPCDPRHVASTVPGAAEGSAERACSGHASVRSRVAAAEQPKSKRREELQTRDPPFLRGGGGCSATTPEQPPIICQPTAHARRGHWL